VLSRRQAIAGAAAALACSALHIKKKRPHFTHKVWQVGKKYCVYTRLPINDKRGGYLFTSRLVKESLIESTKSENETLLTKITVRYGKVT